MCILSAFIFNSTPAKSLTSSYLTPEPPSVSSSSLGSLHTNPKLMGHFLEHQPSTARHFVSPNGIPNLQNLLFQFPPISVNTNSIPVAWAKELYETLSCLFLSYGTSSALTNLSNSASNIIKKITTFDSFTTNSSVSHHQPSPESL